MSREPPTHEILTPAIVRHVEQLISDGFSDETAAGLAQVTPFIVRTVRLRITEDAAARAAVVGRAKSNAILNADLKQIRKLCRGPDRAGVVQRLARAHPHLTRRDLVRITGLPHEVLLAALGPTGEGRPAKDHTSD